MNALFTSILNTTLLVTIFNNGFNNTISFNRGKVANNIISNINISRKIQNLSKAKKIKN